MKRGGRLERSTPLARKARLKKTGGKKLVVSHEKKARKALEKDLTTLCRRLVVELRDGNRCQRCGATAETHKIDWSHVVTRAAKSIKWSPWNSKALCAGCHRWWAMHPLEAGPWWRLKFPERALQYDSWRTQRRRNPLDRFAMKVYLEQEIAKYAV